jgi:ketosteroid isomerase-like protein
MKALSTPLLVLALATACRATAPPSSADERAAIERLLDGWHAAASRADGPGYLGAMDDDAVYLGTDPGERWTLAEFRAFCEPYFARGTGWTYEPRERHVVVEGDLAWFDERLWNAKYGDCRGTGVLRRRDGAWKLAHYSLTLLIPNEKAAAVVELVRR